MGQITWSACWGVVCRVGCAIAWVFGKRVELDANTPESRNQGRLDVKQIEQTALAFLNKATARIDKLEKRVDDCDDDRAKLHEKCDAIEAKHEECEERSKEQNQHIQKLSTELQAVKTTVEDSIRVNGDR